MYLQFHIYKNISVSFDFITTWNQGVFLCSSFIMDCQHSCTYISLKDRVSLEDPGVDGKTSFEATRCMNVSL